VKPFGRDGTDHPGKGRKPLVGETSEGENGLDQQGLFLGATWETDEKEESEARRKGEDPLVSTGRAYCYDLSRPSDTVRPYSSSVVEDRMEISREVSDVVVGGERSPRKGEEQESPFRLPPFSEKTGKRTSSTVDLSE
jgi:hypothetical protein